MTTHRPTQGARPPFRRGGRRRRQCYCKENTVDYKDVSSIRRFITDRGRIEPGKKSGNCAKCQRNLTTAIKRARHLALLPFAPDHLRVTGFVTPNARAIDDEEEISTDDEQTKATAESVDNDGTTEAAPEAAADDKPEDAVVTEVATDDASDESESEKDSSEQVEATDDDAEVHETSDDEPETESEGDESPEDTVEAKSEEDDSTAEAESEEPSEDVSTSEPETDAEPETEADSDEEDK